MGVVLGRRADHRGPADIDILDRVLEAAVGIGDGLLERVEVDDHEVYGLDAVFAHDIVVDAAAAQNAAVHLRMQGLDAPRHHFGEARVIRNFGHRDAFVGDQSGGAAGGQQFDAEAVEVARQVGDTVFVRDADQRAANGFGHVMSVWVIAKAELYPINSRPLLMFDMVLLEFLAQGSAVNAQAGGGFRLVVVAMA